MSTRQEYIDHCVGLLVGDPEVLAYTVAKLAGDLWDAKHQNPHTLQVWSTLFATNLEFVYQLDDEGAAHIMRGTNTTNLRHAALSLTRKCVDDLLAEIQKQVSSSDGAS